MTLDALGRRTWPKPLDPAGFHGLAGEITHTIDPHTEADPVAVLVSLLVSFGNVIGRGAGFRVGGTFHATNLNVLLVGPTSSGRKGTAGDEAARVFQMVDEEWVRQRVVSGLSTGEGLIWQVRDPITRRRKARKGEVGDKDDGRVEEEDDPGEDDKRLMVVEAEFAQATKMMQREGNTLSPTVRRLWDRGDARSMVKTFPGKTTGTLVSIIGHISAEELRRQLHDTEIANGFANRFAFVCSRRSKRLPVGGALADDELRRFVLPLHTAIGHGMRSRELDFDAGGETAWRTMYDEIDEEHFGRLGAVLRRGVPIVRRFAVIYALMDCDSVVRAVHLRAAAALAVLRGLGALRIRDATGSRIADKLRARLREARADWIPREELRKAAGGNSIRAGEIEAALAMLLDHAIAETAFAESTGGRRAEVWRSLEQREEWEETPASNAGREPSSVPPTRETQNAISSRIVGRIPNLGRGSIPPSPAAVPPLPHPRPRRCPQSA